MRRKTEARRLSFVQAAGKLFIEHGFGTVTMEAIAAEAGASKVTLYSYFPNKDELFGAFAAEAGKGVIETLETSREEAGLQATLQRLGMAYLNLVTRPEVINLNRLVIGEAGRYPQLSRIFYENGPRQTLISICNVLDNLMQRGLLRQAELRRTGLYFKALCEAGLVERQLWGLDQQPAEETRREAVDAAIEAFLPAYDATQTHRHKR
ncbi:TetR/AcrR family transcriptional regulator [Kosakonia radicincitans]|uniref:TetR/AcrR family transcriptional regulator n=1 Tax=Kosakonia radicincitans TaxID=283686 RepID=UPI001D05FE7D|nr:TetR/AcrR family transcriptional regulator [Kosakonia radicincitans]